MSIDHTMSLELVRLMYDEGKARVDAQRAKEPLTSEQYFSQLQGVVNDIKKHLETHQINGTVEALVRFGEDVTVVLVNLADMQVTQDPQDSTRPYFHIPCVRKNING